MPDNVSNSPVIRKMAPSDLDQIVEIDIKVLEKPRPAYWEMKLELVEKHDQFSALVAELDGKVVGFIIGGVSRWGIRRSGKYRLDRHNRRGPGVSTQRHCQIAVFVHDGKFEKGGRGRHSHLCETPRLETA
jgi:hypothetical protein